MTRRWFRCLRLGLGDCRRCAVYGGAIKRIHITKTPKLSGIFSASLVATSWFLMDQVSLYVCVGPSSRCTCRRSLPRPAYLLVSWVTQRAHVCEVHAWDRERCQVPQ